MMEHETKEHWRERLGIEIGISKQRAFEIFLEWRSTKKTCDRCEGDKYFDLCPVRLICQEADNVRDATGNDNRTRATKTPEPQTVRAGVPSHRKRDSLRQTLSPEESLFGRRPDEVVQGTESIGTNTRNRTRSLSQEALPSSQIVTDRLSFVDYPEGIAEHCPSCGGMFCIFINERVSCCTKKQFQTTP